MTESTQVQSLAARAKRLTALSRAKSENAKETQEQGQAETALNGLKAELAALAGALATHARLRDVGVPVASLPNLSTPLQRLRDHVESTGRPTYQFLNARKTDVTRAVTAITVQSQKAWASWAKAEIANLRLDDLPKLNPADRRKVTRNVESMKRTASASKITRSDITIFCSELASIVELLGSVGTSESDGVLSRFVSGRILLSLLTDEEIATLRGDEALKDQLYVVIS